MDSSPVANTLPVPGNRGRRLWGRIALALALTGYGVLIAWNMGAGAGGADSSGYLNNARLISEGKLQVEQRVITGLPPEKLPTFSYVPLGFIPVGNDHMVPTYPLGLSVIIVGVSKLTGWAAAANVTMWLHAIGGILVMFALVRATGFSATAAWIGVLLLAMSPLYLQMSLQAMSDLPALVWSTLAVLFAWQSRRRDLWALATGAAVAVGVLVRPTDLLVMAPVALCLGFSWRRWLWLALGGLPGAVAMALSNHALYGSAFTTGYGAVGSIFSWTNVRASGANYAEWLYVILTPGLALVVALPWFLRRGPDRLLAAVLTVWIVVFLGFYAFYFHTHEAWWYLRFVMPAFPPMILAMLLAARSISVDWSGKILRFATAVVVLGIVAWQVVWGLRLPVLDSGRSERVYEETAQWTRNHLPANAVFLTMQASGSMFFYTDFPVVRWDELDASSFAVIERTCEAAGRPIYAVLFPFEQKDVLETRLPGRWTQVSAVRHMTVWRRDGPGKPAAPPVPWQVLVMARNAGIDAVAKLADGWFGIEHNYRHTWSWCGGDGGVDVEISPRETRTVQLAFDLRSVVPRPVSIIQNGVTLWRGEVGPKFTSVTISFPVNDGATRLAFTTDSPAVQENTGTDARPLTFAIYDPRMTLTEVKR